MKKNICLLALLGSLAQADSFVAGSRSIGITVGSGSVSYSGGVTGTAVENYFIAGVSGDYFVADDLSVGLGYRGWFGGTPVIHQATLPVTYYMPTESTLRPYLGGFYRYTHIGDKAYADYSSAGGRFGLAMLFKNGYAGFGWVQEIYFGRKYVSERSSGYPEVVIGFSF